MSQHASTDEQAPPSVSSRANQKSVATRPLLSQQSYKSAFVNELGNQIVVDVSTAPPDDAIACQLVTVKLLGPTSVSENIITIEEARKLHGVLGTFLAAVDK